MTTMGPTTTTMSPTSTVEPTYKNYYVPMFGDQYLDKEESKNMKNMTLTFLIPSIITSVILSYFVYTNYTSNGFNYMTIVLGLVLLICIICIVFESILYNSLGQ